MKKLLSQKKPELEELENSQSIHIAKNENTSVWPSYRQGQYGSPVSTEARSHSPRRWKEAVQRSTEPAFPSKEGLLVPVRPRQVLPGATPLPPHVGLWAVVASTLECAGSKLRCRLYCCAEHTGSGSMKSLPRFRRTRLPGALGRLGLSWSRRGDCACEAEHWAEEDYS